MRIDRRDVARTAFAVGAVAGLLHAAVSFYWAVGGRWQLESVGDWAVTAANDHPMRIGATLTVVAVVKAVAATAPIVNERRPGRHYRLGRAVGWIGGSVLVAWGGLSTLSAAAVLTGIVVPDGGYDRETMLGHALV